MAKVIEAGHRTVPRDRRASHPETRHRRMLEREVGARNDAVLAAARRSRASGAAGIARPPVYASAPRSIGRSFFRPMRRPIKLPSYPFQAERHWRESDRARRMRLGQSVHPLLGNRLEAPQPSWNVELDTADLSYLADHRIGDSIVFPGAGYVEMALAAARETFGPVPCVVEDIEFQKFLVLDENAALLGAGGARCRRRASSRSMPAPMLPTIPGTCMRADASDKPADRHRPASTSHKSAGVVPIRSIEEECYRRFADMRVQLWPDVSGDRAAMAGRTGSSGRDTRPTRRERAIVRLSLASGRSGRLFSNPAGSFADVDDLAGRARQNLRAGEDRARPLSCHASEPPFSPTPD